MNKLNKEVPYTPNIENYQDRGNDKLLKAIKKYKQQNKVELCKDGDSYFIRKGMCRDNCVVDSLTKKDLMTLMVKIDKLLCHE